MVDKANEAIRAVERFGLHGYREPNEPWSTRYSRVYLQAVGTKPG